MKASSSMTFTFHGIFNSWIGFHQLNRPKVSKFVKRSAFSYLIVHPEVGKKWPKNGTKCRKHRNCWSIVSINDRSELIFGENDENVARHKKPWWYKTSEIRSLINHTILVSWLRNWSPGIMSHQVYGVKSKEDVSFSSLSVKQPKRFTSKNSVQ